MKLEPMRSAFREGVMIIFDLLNPDNDQPNANDPVLEVPRDVVNIRRLLRAQVIGIDGELIEVEI